MTNIAEKVSDLIDQRLSRINTLLIGSVTRVDTGKMLVDLKLSPATEEESSPMLLNVPVLFPKFGGSAIVICPKVGDMVVVGVTKHERDPQLTGLTEVKINPYRNFSINNAVVLSGSYTSGESKPPLVAGEMTMRHVTGSSITFKADGSIEILASKVKFIKR